jgi:hypothetical protein
MLVKEQRHQLALACLNKAVSLQPRCVVRLCASGLAVLLPSSCPLVALLLPSCCPLGIHLLACLERVSCRLFHVVSATRPASLISLARFTYLFRRPSLTDLFGPPPGATTLRYVPALLELGTLLSTQKHYAAAERYLQERALQKSFLVSFKSAFFVGVLVFKGESSPLSHC